MSESPGLIGSNRIGLTSRAASLGTAQPVPLGERTAPAAFQGKSAAEMRAEHQAWADEQPIATLCGFCDWRFDGTAAEGREQARLHREAEHPETIGRRTPRRRGIGRPDVKLTDAEYQQAQRARAEKDEQAQLATIERARQRAALEAMDAGEPQDREEGLRASPPPTEATDGATSSVSPPRDPSGLVLPAPDAEASSQAGDDGASISTRGDTMREKSAGRGCGGPGHSPVGDFWTDERIIAAIRAHATRTGFIPQQRDWTGNSTEDHPNVAIVVRRMGSWSDAIEAAGYPRPRRGGKPVAIADLEGSERAERSAPATRPESTRPAPAPEPDTKPKPEPEQEPSHELVLVEPALRDPIRTADIRYDAEILENEAEFLRQRAAALEQIAAGVRELARVSSREEVQEDLAA